MFDKFIDSITLIFIIIITIIATIGVAICEIFESVFNIVRTL